VPGWAALCRATLPSVGPPCRLWGRPAVCGAAVPCGAALPRAGPSLSAGPARQRARRGPRARPATQPPVPRRWGPGGELLPTCCIAAL